MTVGLREVFKDTKFYHFMAANGPGLETFFALCIVAADVWIGVSAYVTWYEVVRESEFFWWSLLVYLVLAFALNALRAASFLIYRVFFKVSSFDESRIENCVKVHAHRFIQPVYYLSILTFAVFWYYEDANADYLEGSALPPFRAGDQSQISSQRCLLAIFLLAFFSVIASLFMLYAFWIKNEASVHLVASMIGSAGKRPRRVSELQAVQQKKMRKEL